MSIEKRTFELKNRTGVTCFEHWRMVTYKGEEGNAEKAGIVYLGLPPREKTPAVVYPTGSSTAFFGTATNIKPFGGTNGFDNPHIKITVKGEYLPIPDGE